MNKFYQWGFCHKKKLIGIFGSATIFYTTYYKCNRPEFLVAKPNTLALLAQKENCQSDVIIIGGGVVGVSTAYALRKKGLKVQIIEANSETGQECSEAALGAMPRSNPRIDKQIWKATLQSMVCSLPVIRSLVNRNSDSNNDFQWFAINWLATMTDPHFLRWFLNFSTTSLWTDPAIIEQRASEMLCFTDMAITELITLTRTNPYLGRQADIRQLGALKLHFSEKEFSEAQKKSSWSGYEEHEHIEFLGKEECHLLEPFLKKSQRTPELVGATFQTESFHGNCGWFTRALTQLCKDLDVKYKMNTRLSDFILDRNSNIIGLEVITKENNMPVKEIIKFSNNTIIVVCAGSWTPLILRKLGLYVPVYPLKGHSLIVDLESTSANGKELKNNFPKRVIVDGPIWSNAYHDQLRVTSGGQFDGWNTLPDYEIKKGLIRQAIIMYPAFKESIEENAKIIAGLRPYASDGLILVGKINKYSNLHVVCGPGANGWKTAIGAGKVSADLIERDIIRRATITKNCNNGRNAINIDNDSKNSDNVCNSDGENIEKMYDFNLDLISPDNRVVYSPMFSFVCSKISSLLGND